MAAAAAVDSAPVVISQPITEQVAEVAPTVVDVLQEAGPELRLAELGLGNYTPVGAIQNLLEFFHMDLGMPWWGAIALGKLYVQFIWKMGFHKAKLHQAFLCAIPLAM